MNYIVDLSRSRHFDASLFDAPYDERGAAAISAGRMPEGPPVTGAARRPAATSG